MSTKWMALGQVNKRRVIYYQTRVQCLQKCGIKNAQAMFGEYGFPGTYSPTSWHPRSSPILYLVCVSGFPERFYLTKAFCCRRGHLLFFLFKIHSPCFW